MTNISTLGGNGRGAPVADVSTLSAEPSRHDVGHANERFDAHFARALSDHGRPDGSRSNGSEAAARSTRADRTHRSHSVVDRVAPIDRRAEQQPGDGKVDPSSERDPRASVGAKVRPSLRRDDQEKFAERSTATDVAEEIDTGTGVVLDEPSASEELADPIDTAKASMVVAVLVAPPLVASPDAIPRVDAQISPLPGLLAASDTPVLTDAPVVTDALVMTDALVVADGRLAAEGPMASDAAPGEASVRGGEAPPMPAAPSPAGVTVAGVTPTGAPTAGAPTAAETAPVTDTSSDVAGGSIPSAQAPSADASTPPTGHDVQVDPSATLPAAGAPTGGTRDTTGTSARSDMGADRSATIVLPEARALQARARMSETTSSPGAVVNLGAAAMQAAQRIDENSDAPGTGSNPGDPAAKPDGGPQGQGIDHRAGQSSFADSIRTAAAAETTRGADPSAAASAPRPPRDVDLLRTPGLDRMSIDLSDEGLGPLTLQAANGIGGLQLRLTAGERAVGDALAAGAHLLREELEASGTRLGSLDVGHRDARNPNTRNSDAEGGAGRGRDRDGIDPIGDNLTVGRSLAATSRTRPAADAASSLDLLI